MIQITANLNLFQMNYMMNKVFKKLTIRFNRCKIL